MKTRFILILFFIVACSCKAKDSTPEGLSSDLKLTMQKYLYQQVNNDSTKVKYNVEDVTYFEDVKQFICEFKVHLKAKSTDTTGYMKAYISKDFKIVTRVN